MSIDIIVQLCTFIVIVVRLIQQTFAMMKFPRNAGTEYHHDIMIRDSLEFEREGVSAHRAIGRRNMRNIAPFQPYTDSSLCTNSQCKLIGENSHIQGRVNSTRDLCHMFD